MSVIYFYSHNRNSYKKFKNRAVFSQWYPKTFKGDIGIDDFEDIIDKEDLKNFIIGHSFQNREKWMMILKALLFAKGEYRNYNLNLITKYMLKTDNPRKLKSYGRRVRGFDDTEWIKNRFRIVLNGNYLQFSQNDVLKKILLSTKNAELVEASPYDRVWGIGFNAKNANDRSKWGLNLLGKTLMQVRDMLK